MTDHNRFNTYNYIGSDKHLENLARARNNVKDKKPCEFCKGLYGKAQMKRHSEACYLNPAVMKTCVVCEEPVKNYKTNVTCGYSCSNKHFRTGTNHGNWKEGSYRSTCFAHHRKECVVCHESNIVEVHHLDENHSNNDPANLIPLCPTHHQYWHSRFKDLVEPRIREYIDGWKMVSVPGAAPSSLASKARINLTLTPQR